MSPANDAYLYELEHDVRAELSLADASQPGAAAAGGPGEWLLDPADAQRDEVGLRDLLGAVEALENG